MSPCQPFCLIYTDLGILDLVLKTFLHTAKGAQTTQSIKLYIIWKITNKIQRKVLQLHLSCILFDIQQILSPGCSFNRAVIFCMETMHPKESLIKC